MTLILTPMLSFFRGDFIFLIFYRGLFLIRGRRKPIGERYKDLLEEYPAMDVRYLSVISSTEPHLVPASDWLGSLEVVVGVARTGLLRCTDAGHSPGPRLRAEHPLRLLGARSARLEHCLKLFYFLKKFCFLFSVPERDWLYKLDVDIRP